jgi:DNA-directed RNA polymerase subunit A'
MSSQRKLLLSGITQKNALIRNLGDSNVPKKMESIKPSKLAKEEIKKISSLEKVKLASKQHLLLETLPELMIKNIQFLPASPEYIKKSSVTDVSTDRSQGVDSEFLGPLGDLRLCRTCGFDNVGCPCHMGRIPIPKPVINPYFTELIGLVFRCVCISCMHLIPHREQLENKGILKHRRVKRLEEIAKLASDLPCSRKKKPGDKPCYPSPKKYEYNTYKNLFVAIMADGSRNFFTIEEVRKRLKVLGEDKDALECMDFRNGALPEDLFFDGNFPVLPHAARPSAFVNEVETPNDLTESYINIANKLAQLQKTSKELETDRDKLWNKVVSFIGGIIDNTSSENKVKKSRTKEIQSIRELLQQKEGLIRGALMGKRGDYCGRSVMAPGPDLKVNQIGVPRIFLPILTKKMKVTAKNIEYIQKLQQEDKISLIMKGSGPKKGYYMDRSRNRETSIVIGDIIFRHLQAGDRLMFNRQPTLHRNNMIGLEVVPIDDMVFRVNLSITTGLNLDFDGDEGNVYDPQTEEGISELIYIVGIENNIISGEYIGPIVAIVQDGLTGSFLLTSEEEPLDEALWYDCAFTCGLMGKVEEVQRKCVELGVHPFSGKALVSLLLPSDFYYSSAPGKEGQPATLIRRGILVQGATFKGNMGVVPNSIVHMLHKEYPRDVVLNFLSKVQFMVNRYMYHRVFTVTMRDSTEGLSAESKANIQRILDDILPQILEEYERFENDVQSMPKLIDGSTAPPDPLRILQYERKTRKILDDSFNESIAEIKKVPNDNGYMIMSQSGAKGKISNLIQIMAFLGQQNVNGKRIQRTLANGRRSLPCFDLDDPDPASQGFVYHSFFEGLTPVEYFNHMSGSRDGLIDTAIKTSDTGYQHRKFLKAVEDVKVHYDNSVRMANGALLQPIYGDDGLDTRESIRDHENWTTFINIRRLREKVNERYGYINA